VEAQFGALEAANAESAPAEEEPQPAAATESEETK
jgi:hypothetical protein